MRMNKTLALLLCLMAVLTLLAGCTPVDLTGTWVLTDISGSAELKENMDMIHALGGNMSLIITEDTLTMSVTVLGQTDSDTYGYRIQGSTIVYEDGEISPFKLEGDQLTLTETDGKLIFVRQ